MFFVLKLLSAIATAKIKRWSRVKLDKMFYSGGVIDFIQGIYLVICICSFINLKQGFDIASFNFGAFINYLFACLSLIIVIGFPIFIGVFYQVYYDNLEDEAFEKKYGVIYDGLDLREWGRYTFIYDNLYT